MKAVYLSSANSANANKKGRHELSPFFNALTRFGALIYEALR